jgi:hypothetical protein
MIPELGEARLGAQVGALDVRVRDADAALPLDLVARSHEPAPRRDLELLRPARLGEEFGHIQSDRGVGRHFLIDAADVVAAHEV